MSALKEIYDKFNIKEQNWLYCYSMLNQRDKVRFLRALEEYTDKKVEELHMYEKKYSHYVNSFSPKEDELRASIFYCKDDINFVNMMIAEIKAKGVNTKTYAVLNDGNEQSKFNKTVKVNVVNPMKFIDKSIEEDGEKKPVKMVKFYDQDKEGNILKESGWYRFGEIIVSIEDAYKRINEEGLIAVYHAPKYKKDKVKAKYDNLLVQLGNLAEEFERISINYDDNGDIVLSGARENDIGIKLNKISKK